MPAPGACGRPGEEPRMHQVLHVVSTRVTRLPLAPVVSTMRVEPGVSARSACKDIGAGLSCGPRDRRIARPSASGERSSGGCRTRASGEAAPAGTGGGSVDPERSGGGRRWAGTATIGTGPGRDGPGLRDGCDGRGRGGAGAFATVAARIHTA